MQASHNNSSDRYTGHSKQASVTDALQDAVDQALAAQPGSDRMVEFEVVKIRGRSGGIAGFRDLWVEISVGASKDSDKDKEKEDPGKYTTLAIGEEGGELGRDLGPGMSTRARGEEGGGDEQTFTTMAVGEEGGSL